jgi:RimJ/RimL family protein N-acetyltransferase
MNLHLVPIDEPSARSILGWRYEPPYDLYNADPSKLDEDLAHLLDPATAYYAIRDTEELVGFRCFGRDAQVPGGNYEGSALDTGGGLRPDLTGRGLGLGMLNAGLDFGRAMFHPPAFRVTVAAFNQRALIVCQRAGFEPIQSFVRNQDEREFVMLCRSA